MNIVSSKSKSGTGSLAWTSCALCLGFAVGCGEPQVSLGTRASLLTLAGTFVVADEVADGVADEDAGVDDTDVRLGDVAQLALRFRSDDALHVVPTDWQIDGTDFRLRVLDSPPAAVLRPLSQLWTEEPKLAIGFVAALRKKREGRIPEAWSRGISSVPKSEAAQGCGDCGGPPQPPGFNATGTCKQRQFCTGNDEECYEEYMCCTTSCCTPLGSRGDAALKIDAASYFSGYVVSYAVLYLAGDVHKGTWGAHLLNAPEGLSRGYHLLRAREISEETYAEARDCIDRAVEMAAADENALSRSQIPVDEWKRRTCWSPNLSPPNDLGQPSSFMPICGVGGSLVPDPDCLSIDEFDRQVERAMIELDCPAVSGGYTLEPVEKPDAEFMKLALGPRVRPPSFPLAFEADQPRQTERVFDCTSVADTGLPACNSSAFGEPMPKP